MSIITRKLENATVPQIGPLDITNTNFVIVVQQEDAIFILIRVTYKGNQDDSDVTGDEYVLTPCYDGGNGFLLGLESNNGEYQSPQSLDSIQYYVNTSGNDYIQSYYKINGISLPRFNFQDGTLFTSDGNYLETISQLINTPQGLQQYTFTQTTDSPDQASQYTLTAISNFFLDTTYAGYSYTLTTQTGLIPFRFLIPYAVVNGTQTLPTPSSCAAPAPSKPDYFLCNNYSALNEYNLLRYISYTESDGQYYTASWNFSIDPNPALRQSKPSLCNFFSDTFYFSNAYFTTSGTLVKGEKNVCSTFTNQNFLSSFYFWASGFTSFKNSANDAFQPIISQGIPGFYEGGEAEPVSILNWTDAAGCGTRYFYKYCFFPYFCGQCFGPCLAGTSCQVEPTYTENNTPPGLNPFTCGTTVTPKNALLEFWQKYKVWIIVIGIFFVAFIIFIIVAFATEKSKLNKERAYEQELIQDREGNDLYAKYNSVY